MQILCRVGLHKWGIDRNSPQTLPGDLALVCGRCGRTKVMPWRGRDMDRPGSGITPLTGTTRNTWPRNRSTYPGGGLSADPGGGLYTGPGGGASTGPGGGLSTGPGGGLYTGYGGGLSTAYGGGLSTSYGGGLSTSYGGGLSTSYGGGLSADRSGGLYTGSDGSYEANQPPMDALIPHLRQLGENSIADTLARAHKLNL
jgi:hypothetical protein